MSPDLNCDRCGSTFPIDAPHTEVVRRDFEGEPLPSTVEYLCERCLGEYESFIERP